MTNFVKLGGVPETEFIVRKMFGRTSQALVQAKGQRVCENERDIQV